MSETKIDPGESRQIIEKYFIFNLHEGEEWALPIQASELIENVKRENKLPVPVYKIVKPNLTVENLPSEENFSADDDIAALDVSLIRIGLATVDSCGGHADRFPGYAHVSFWGTELYKVLAIIDDWHNETDINEVTIIVPDFIDELHHAGFSLAFITGNLQTSRQLAKKLSSFIDSKSK